MQLGGWGDTDAIGVSSNFRDAACNYKVVLPGQGSGTAFAACAASTRSTTSRSASNSTRPPPSESGDSCFSPSRSRTNRRFITSSLSKGRACVEPPEPELAALVHRRVPARALAGGCEADFDFVELESLRSGLMDVAAARLAKKCYLGRIRQDSRCRNAMRSQRSVLRTSCSL